jgi:hypothetical protein
LTGRQTPQDVAGFIPPHAAAGAVWAAGRRPGNRRALARHRPRRGPGTVRNRELADAGILPAGEGLKPSSQGKRAALDGATRTAIDGPFAATNGLVAGFWLWQVSDMAEAIAWAQRCPNPMPGPSELELRPVFEAADFGEALTPELAEQEERLRRETEGR